MSAGPSSSDGITEKLIEALLDGSTQALVAILLLINVVLIMDRRRLVQDIERKDEKIEKIVDDYYKGNLTLSEALNSLKMVLNEIQGRL